MWSQHPVVEASKLGKAVLHEQECQIPYENKSLNSRKQEVHKPAADQFSAPASFRFD
jgi:hypothetical protein